MTCFINIKLVAAAVLPHNLRPFGRQGYSTCIEIPNIESLSLSPLPPSRYQLSTHASSLRRMHAIVMQSKMKNFCPIVHVIEQNLDGCTYLH